MSHVDKILMINDLNDQMIAINKMFRMIAAIHCL